MSRGGSSVLDQLAVASNDNLSDPEAVALSKLLPGKQKQHSKIRRRANAKKYYVTDKVAEPDPKDETFPFGYPKGLAVFAQDVLTKAWRNDVRIKQLKLKCAEKTNNRCRQPKDLHRLYVEEPPKDSTKTVCDVDPQYFKVIERKPEKLNMKDYIQTLRDSLRIKIVNGYREDDILLMDENLLLEQKMLDIIRENYQKYVNIFEEFLYKDHVSSKQLLKDSEKAAQAAYDKYQEYTIIAKKLSAVTSTLCITEEKWRTGKTYQNFLYTVSPASWRATHSEYRRENSFIKDDLEDEMNMIGTYRQNVKELNVSITDMIQEFYKDSRNEKPPEIYFTTPDQLLAVFRSLEMQNLNALLQCEELAKPIQTVTDGLRDINKLLSNRMDDTQEIIKKLENAISWEEDRVTYLEELSKNLLDEQFRTVVMGDDVLNLQVFVEEVYELKIGVNSANLGMLEMMTEIENKYCDELLSIEKVPSSEIAVLQYKCFEEEVRVMQLAERASKQYAELERVLLYLNKAYAPPFKKPGGKEVKKRSPLRRVKAIVAPPLSTSMEDDYLEFFTDYCRSTDNLEGVEEYHGVELVPINN